MFGVNFDYNFKRKCGHIDSIPMNGGAVSPTALAFKEAEKKKEPCTECN